MCLLPYRLSIADVFRYFVRSECSFINWKELKQTLIKMEWTRKELGSNIRKLKKILKELMDNLEEIYGSLGIDE